MKRNWMKWIAAGVTVPALLLATAACGDDDDDDDADGGLSVSGVSGQTALGDVGSVYLTIENEGETDYLVSARVLGDLAEQVGDVQHHEVVTQGGSMEMREIEKMEIPGNGSLELKRGGYHIMLLDIDPPIEQGTQVELELTFENNDPIEIVAELGAPSEQDGVGMNGSMTPMHGSMTPMHGSMTPMHGSMTPGAGMATATPAR
jgi:copper(I)-binding protein